MRLLLLALLFVGLGLTQDTNTPDFLLHSGVSTDFVSHQPSAIFGFSAKVGSIGGVPTFLSTLFETSLIKLPNASNTLTLAPGFLQIPYHQQHWGLYYFSNAGVTKFDAATLLNLQGGGGAYIDFGGMATKDKYHVWLSGGPRQIALAGVENKLNWLIEITTAFKRGQ